MNPAKPFWQLRFYPYPTNKASLSAVACFSCRISSLVALIYFAWNCNPIHAQHCTYTGQDGKTYVRFISMAHPGPVNMKGYDPRLLIPHWNPETRKWGYIRRETRELVVPHRFHVAGSLADGFAFAIELSPDSVLQHVWRIDSEGASICIFRDTTSSFPAEPQWYYANDRLDDNYLGIQRGSSFGLFSPLGKMLYDTTGLIPDFSTMHTTLGWFWPDSADVTCFLSPEGRVTARYPDSEYSMYHPNYSPTFWDQGVYLFPIIRRSDHKEGIIDTHGRIVVPFIWDTIPQGGILPGVDMTRMEKDFDLYFYRVTLDSLYYGFRDGRIHLAHLDGRVLHTYPPSELPLGPRWPVWKEQGLYPVVRLLPGGIVSAYAYKSLMDGMELSAKDGLHPLNDHVMIMYEDKGMGIPGPKWQDHKPQRPRFYDIEAGEYLKSVGEQWRSMKFRILQTFAHQGRYYQVYQLHGDSLVGLFDDQFRMLMPDVYNQIVFNACRTPCDYPLFEGDRPKYKWGEQRLVSISGMPLFSRPWGLYFPNTSPNDAKGEYYSSYAWEFLIDPHRMYHCVPYSNMLIRSHRVTVGGVEYRGFEDVSGKKYF